jgi:tetratricopeptide (TPR) repeat protein
MFKEERAMRYTLIRHLALLALLMVSATALRAAEDVRPSSASATLETIQLQELTDVGATTDGSAKNAAISTSTRPKVSQPTPARHKPAVTTNASLAAADQSIAAPSIQELSDATAAGDIAVKAKPASAATAKSEMVAKAPKTKSAEESLQPIPDSLESGPTSIEAASFKGVTPGMSTKDEVTKAWGEPKETADRKDALVQLYSVGPFNRVEVNYVGNKVGSLVVRFDRPFPVDAMAKQLDLATVRPVLVSNDMGEVLGLVYPERGVLFAFAAAKDSDKPTMQVASLVLEPIAAEPFVLRAETTLDSRCDLSRRDLEQAIELEPNNARAHWLLSRVLANMDQPEKSLAAVGRAVQLDPDNPRYRATRAQVLAQTGRLEQALAEAEKATAASQKLPHVEARVLCLMGDLMASGPKPDYHKAISFHTRAIQIADPLSRDQHPAIRQAAKEALIDAHLGAAHDIAWGEWTQKNKAVARWLERALALADDLAKSDGGNSEQVFRVYVRAMAAYVGIRGEIDPGPTAVAVVATGEELIASTRDPSHKAQLQGDLGLALYDAVQIYQMRSDQDNALKYGQQAAKYLAKANELKQSPSSTILLSRLYFRLGTIHATRDRDHRAAVTWFDKALQIIDRQSPEALAADLGRHGESLVSMGVSYWEAGQRQKAVALTEKGIKWMERAMKQGQLSPSTMAVPYNNLAAMHRKLGAADLADHFQAMASRAKQEKLK